MQVCDSFTKSAHKWCTNFSFIMCTIMKAPKKVPTDLKAGRSKVIQLLRFLTTVLLCSHWSQRVRGYHTKNVCFLTRKCLQHLPMSVVRKSFRSLKGALKIIQFSKNMSYFGPKLFDPKPTCTKKFQTGRTLVPLPLQPLFGSLQ